MSAESNWTDVPPGQREVFCVCGGPLHVGSIMSSWLEEIGQYEAIVIYASEKVPEPAHRTLTLISLTDSGSRQHIGDICWWQLEVGTPIRCGTAGDVPAPCASGSPAGDQHRALRRSWLLRNLPGWAEYDVGRAALAASMAGAGFSPRPAGGDWPTS